MLGPLSYVGLHPGTTPNDIEASKDWITTVTLGVDGSYGDCKAALSTAVQNYKDFTTG
jgi:hypothetical protein